MSVSDRVRQIEKGIDAEIRKLPIWQGSRAEVLSDLVQAYRDAIELSSLLVLRAKTLNDSLENFDLAFGIENRTRAGYLWALKWASEYCPEVSTYTNRTPEEIGSLCSLGAVYETFVDALKYAQRDLITIKVDEASRTITFYEGGSVTAFDSKIIHQQRTTSPMTHHVSLTEDSDQLTSRWIAGDYRRVTKSLAKRAAHKENTITLDSALLKQVGKSDISIPQPTVIWLERPTITPDCDVFDDLTLPASISDKVKWKLVSLLDTPIVKVGDRYCGLSSDLKIIAAIDDYMLRLAVRVDPDQYNVASILRESRMISICRNVLEKAMPPWSVREHVHYEDPHQEADVIAIRGNNTIVIQLKSTLLPETPWEVYKRNEDVINGVNHTKKLVDRGIANQGFVVTNGYRGDYVCWAKSLASSVPIATLRDLDVIASDPSAAVAKLKNRVGIKESPSGQEQGIADREDKLMGWVLKFLDRETPKENPA